MVKVDQPDISFDVVVNNELALRNSQLLGLYVWGGGGCLVTASTHRHRHRLLRYAAMDTRARQLIFLVKAWAKARSLNDAPNGNLSSYAHVILVIFFLSTRKDTSGREAPLLPNLQAPELNGRKSGAAADRAAAAVGGAAAAGGVDDKDEVDGLDVSFSTNVRAAVAALSSRDGEVTIAQLVVEYFAWMNWLMTNTTKYTVSIKVSGGGGGDSCQPKSNQHRSGVRGWPWGSLGSGLGGASAPLPARPALTIFHSVTRFLILT